MTHADRSLSIAVIGLGQAGGNIAAEFQRRGYPALALNTARGELAALGLPEDQRIHIGLEGLEGAGGDVESGRECIAANADRIHSVVAEHAAGADVVIVAAGLGGGIGSCAPELVALLREQNLPVVALTALPHHHESGIAKVNALCAVRDLASEPPFGWVLIDNAKLARLHHDVPINAYFETINRDIVEPLDVFNRLNDREGVAPIRTLGGEDLRTLLLAGGILNYHAIAMPKLTGPAVLDALRSALAEHPIMPSGSELANVAYLGLVIEASERALAECPFSFYEQIAEQTKRETGGAAVYVGLYRTAGSDDAPATLRMIASAHALPASIAELTAEAQREAGAIQQKAAQHVAALDLGGLERLRPAPVRQGARTARRADPRPRVEAPPQPAPSEGAAPPAVATPAPTSRGRYERLANAFRAATTDDVRSRIAGELSAAQQSEDALERFYAVNAMSRADAAYFRDTLRTAARDTDRHVSDLARRALEKLARAS